MKSSISNNNLVMSLCLIYIIVYIVVKVWFKPNYEPFSQGEKIVRIRDVIGANGLMEVTFRKPDLEEGDELTKYEIVLSKDGSIIGKKTLTDYLNQDLVKYAINDTKITDNTAYSVSVIGTTKNNKRMESVPFAFKTNDRNRNIIELNEDILQDMDENRQIFLRQETEQNTQNRIITDLKKRVDLLRNDIVVMKNKDKDELRSIQNVVQSDDSIAQVLSMPNGINGVGSASEMLSKNYNVNLNLE
tara:strand:- start:4384 stop:5118 length:735 start_codon:yes stop_codon:yes gene_type:complete